MRKNNDRFYSANGKRLILVADDEFINREILSGVLSDNYDIVFAEDGQEALDKVEEYRELLSLVLLDLMMPKVSGIEVLKRIKENPDTQKIPVIVMTADSEAEVESLAIGAADFIPKPYPQVKVIQARVLKTIELSEDRQIISSTERDPITGLYNKEYFYRYAEQYDQHHPDVSMDAIVIDVHHFHVLNERFGTTFGDAILRKIGLSARECVSGMDGIVCRREGDTFMIYCPHGADYKYILDQVSIGIETQFPESHVRLRMGVYVDVDKSLDIVRRFDRAKSASDLLRGNAAKSIEIYDDQLHEKEMYAARLVDDFHRALAEGQFIVYYQPKYDIRSNTPTLLSAEALVRWRHPELGMISPGTFIPLFEENGLIQELDRYVWRVSAEQIDSWRRKFGFTVPVSVNVSRIDTYDPGLPDVFCGLIEKYDLDPSELLLEITESAYTGESVRILKTINELRNLGFRIEMDDFGSGYSSLNMLSKLPIDALKMDMDFVRTAFSAGGDTRLIELIIEIASYLSVPVIAEGVETKEQVQKLRMIGCDIIQGYYFSKPVPADEFEKFIIEAKEAALTDPKGGASSAARKDLKRDGVTYSSISHALIQDFFTIYYVDVVTDSFIEYSSSSDYKTLGIEQSGDDFFNLSRQNIMKFIYEGDRERLLSVFTKENILREIAENRTFTFSYRLLIDGEPTYVRLKAAGMKDKNDNHIVIGLCDVSSEMKREGRN